MYFKLVRLSASKISCDIDLKHVISGEMGLNDPYTAGLIPA
jgi:hypothetical protein